MDSEKKKKKSFHFRGRGGGKGGGGIEKPRTIPVYVYQREGRKWTKKLNFNEFEGEGGYRLHIPPVDRRVLKSKNNISYF